MFCSFWAGEEGTLVKNDPVHDQRSGFLTRYFTLDPRSFGSAEVNIIGKAPFRQRWGSGKKTRRKNLNTNLKRRARRIGTPQPTGGF